jgi:FAD/FMN-containing dehydrogenase
VGIAGHALHGGYGYASRKWGIALDHIIGLDVVLANGTQIYTDATSYPDIFYAMRGAGDSFGIVTYFHMATEKAPASVVYFTAGLVGY